MLMTETMGIKVLKEYSKKLEIRTYLNTSVWNHWYSVFYLGLKIKFPASFQASLNLVFVQNLPLPYMNKTR